MKDYWKLLEEAKMGGKDSFVKMIDEAIPEIYKYYATIYQNNQTLAVENTCQVLEKAFINLNYWNHQKLFMTWLLIDMSSVKKENLSAEFKDEQFLQKFTEVYSNELCRCHFPFDSFMKQNFSIEDKTKSANLIQLALNAEKIDIETIVSQIRNRLAQLKNDFGFMYRSNRTTIFSVMVIIAVVGVLIILFKENYSPKKEIDFNRLRSIKAPMDVIFEDFYTRMTYHSSDNEEDDEGIDENTDKTFTHAVVIEKEPEDQKKIIESDKNTIEIVKPEITKPTEKTIEKTKNVETNKVNEKPAVGLETAKEETPLPVKKEVEPSVAPNNKSNSKSKIDPIIEDELDETENQQEMVIIKGNEIPIIPKSELEKNDGIIRIGGDEKKYNLKEFKDQKVIFYSFLEVKDVEKAKEEAFKILKKFGYKGEVFKKEKDYLILTATFPGKENHDRMIRKFNGLGTLYVGNDVSEFLELYKKDLDKERSQFFPKYKPEDLPKEVTVNLYVFPKQKKE